MVIGGKCRYRKILSLLLLAIFFALLPSQLQAKTFTHQQIPYSEVDFVNPGRGQYRSTSEASWNTKQLDGSFLFLGQEFPNGTATASSNPEWPSVKQQNFRITWRSLEDDAGNYDFRSIDAMLEQAKQTNSRVGLRVMALETVSQSPIGPNLYSALPDRFTDMAAATETISYSDNQYIVPLWDSDVYLSELEALLTALGERYDSNEYLSSFEISGLGNFSEWHAWPFADHYGGSDRPWNQATIERLIDANVAAFAETQLIGFAVDTRANEYAMSLGSQYTKKPIGIRVDSLGLEGMDHTEERLNSVASAAERWKSAPILFEYSSSDSTPEYYGGLYGAGRVQIQQYHGSMVGSSNFPHSWNGIAMTSQQYEDWSLTNKFAGYRYGIAQTNLPSALQQGKKLHVSALWQNYGVAPTYDDWLIEYFIKPKDGQARFKLGNSTLELGEVYYDGSSYQDTESVPKVGSLLQKDVLTLPNNLDTGEYDIFVKVIWNEHKIGATSDEVYNIEPMYLAMTGRTNDDDYKLGSFTLTRHLSAQDNISTTDSTKDSPSIWQQYIDAIFGSDRTGEEVEAVIEKTQVQKSNNNDKSTNNENSVDSGRDYTSREHGGNESGSDLSGMSYLPYVIGGVGLVGILLIGWVISRFSRS